MKKKEKYLGEMLVIKGLVTEDQLQIMIQEQFKKKQFLGEMLVEKGLITEDDLFHTIAEQFNIELVQLADEEIDWDVTVRFSSSLIAEHKCLPLRAEEDTIVVAITNPLNVWALDIAEKEAAPNKIKIVLLKNSDMDAAIKEYHKHIIRKKMTKRNYKKEGVSVLVVDDDKGTCNLFIKTLKEYNVTTAENGTQAIDLAKENSFDIAFIDMRMPGLNGCETFIELKKIQPNITGVIITQYSDEDLRVDSFIAGTVSYFKKPLDIGEIRKLVLHEDDIREKGRK